MSSPPRKLPAEHAGKHLSSHVVSAGVVDRLDELLDGFVGGLDLAVDELRDDILIGIGDGRRRTVTLCQRAEQRAAFVRCLQVGDALLPQASKSVSGTSVRAGTEPLTTLKADWKLFDSVAVASATQAALRSSGTLNMPNMSEL